MKIVDGKLVIEDAPVTGIGEKHFNEIAKFYRDIKEMRSKIVSMGELPAGEKARFISGLNASMKEMNNWSKKVLQK